MTDGLFISKTHSVVWRMRICLFSLRSEFYLILSHNILTGVLTPGYDRYIHGWVSTSVYKIFDGTLCMQPA